MHVESKPAGGAAPERMSEAPVVVIDPRIDHRELIVEALEESLPGRVLACACVDDGVDAAAAVVVSMESDPAAVLRWIEEVLPFRPVTLALTCPDRIWSTEDERRLGAEFRLDKGAGASFLHDLTRFVTQALGGAVEPRRASEPPPTPHVSEAPSGPPVPAAAESDVCAPVLGALTAELADRAHYVAAASQELHRRLEAEPVARAALAGLRREAERCSALARRIGSLVDSHLSAEPRVRLRLCDFVRLREEAWRLWTWGGSDHLVTRTDPAAPPGWVHPDWFGPAVDRLVTHAAREAEAGGQRVVMRCDGVLVDDGTARQTPGLRPGRYARLRVELDDESGCAEPGEVVPRTFPIDDRLRALAIAAAKSERGYFQLSYDEGRALHATFFVPAAEESRVPVRSTTQRPRVLVVDDDEPIQEICAAVISEVGAEPVQAGSGREAIERLEAGCRYDLVLLDLMMPGLDGQQTFRGLRRHDPGLPAVLMSGSPDARVVREMMNEGLLGFLRKPFDVPTLARTLRACLADLPLAHGSMT